jgi:hypothetical protein
LRGQDHDDLSKSLHQQDQQTDFALVLGIGSLIDSPAATDYTVDTNIISSTSLGTASPQYLIGASFRVPFQGGTLFARGRKWDDCYSSRKGGNDANGSSDSAGAPSTTGGSNKPFDEYCDAWRLHPWSGFLSLKFSPSSSQTLSGYVLGGSYQFAKYLSGLVGFGFTPFNEASKGLRVTASQYVSAQQKQGNLLNFSPQGMLTGGKNAFDGFSLLDSSGKLIYSGKPLEVHYRAGVVVGVSIPLSFGSAFGQKSPQ